MFLLAALKSQCSAGSVSGSVKKWNSDVQMTLLRINHECLRAYAASLQWLTVHRQLLLRLERAVFVRGDLIRSRWMSLPLHHHLLICWSPIMCHWGPGGCSQTLWLLIWLIEPLREAYQRNRVPRCLVWSGKHVGPCCCFCIVWGPRHQRWTPPCLLQMFREVKQKNKRPELSKYQRVVAQEEHTYCKYHVLVLCSGVRWAGHCGFNSKDFLRFHLSTGGPLMILWSFMVQRTFRGFSVLSSWT